MYVFCKYIGSKEVHIENNGVSKLYITEEYRVDIHKELKSMLGSDKVKISICYNDDVPELIILEYSDKNIKIYIDKFGTEVNENTFNIPDYRVVIG